MAGLAILLAFDFIGLVLHALGVPLPGNVLGLILLVICLFTGVVKLEWIEQVSLLLVRNMMLFFAPVIVGVILFKDRIAHEWLAIGAGIVGSLLVVLLVTGWSVELLLRKGERNKDGR